MNLENPVDPTLCPLCGQPNGCHLASNDPHKGPCWCASLSVPSALLEKVPEIARRKACICRRCVEKNRR